MKHKVFIIFLFLSLLNIGHLLEARPVVPVNQTVARHRMVEVNGLNMHIVEQGEGPLVLFLHGFPQIWYTWRHQIPYMAARGFRAVAPDLRGYGDTTGANNSDPSKSSFVHVAGDVIRLLDIIAPGEKVFVVGHDFGAYTSWYLSLFRPDRVKALITFSVQYIPWSPSGSYLDFALRTFGKDYYMIRFQKPGDIEAEFAKIGTRSTMARFLSYHSPQPLFLPEGGGGLGDINATIVLPPWITEKDLDYYTSKFEKSGFTGGLNYYRSLDLFWELTKAWSEAKVIVPTIYAAGDMDLQYHTPGVMEYVQDGGMKKDVPLLKKVYILKGAGHYIQEERPDEVNKIIYNFFKKF